MAAKTEGLSILDTPEGMMHLLATELASRSSVESAQKFESGGDDIVRGALMMLIEDAALTHDSILVLVKSGFSGNAAANLRTLFDLQIAMAAILKSKNPRLTAFKYFYSGLWSLSKDDKRFAKALRADLRAQVNDRIRSLAAEDQDVARQFCKERNRDYFFSPEWRSPKEVLAQEAAPDMDYLYGKLSSAAHGGYFGMRLFRDDPSKRGASAQFPPGTRALSLLAASARFLLEMVILRAAHEGLPVETKAREVVAKIREAYGYGEGDHLDTGEDAPPP